MLQLFSVSLLNQSLMAFEMKCKMVRPGKGTFAVGTFERLDASVLAVVTGELIRAGKLPSTSLPCTFVWLLPSVSPQMGFEVRTLCVHLTAARIGATVGTLVLLWLHKGTEDVVHSHWVLKVWCRLSSVVVRNTVSR